VRNSGIQGKFQDDVIGQDTQVLIVGSDIFYRRLSFGDTKGLYAYYSISQFGDPILT
jgi:pyruvate/2-oxoglutarate/acetoin dehydrogenase E1 component